MSVEPPNKGKQPDSQKGIGGQDNQPKFQEVPQKNFADRYPELEQQAMAERYANWQPSSPSSNGPPPPPIKRREEPKIKDHKPPKGKKKEKKEKHQQRSSATGGKQQTVGSTAQGNQQGREMASLKTEGPSGLGTSIDKIVQVFQNNPIFQSHVAHIQVATMGSEAQISVMLNNGVHVRVNLAPGGKELNVQVQGITAKAQAAMDDPKNQEDLRQRLSEQGFIVHKIQTERGEGATFTAPPPPAQPTTPTAPQTPTTPEEEAGGGGEEEGREEEEERG